MGSGEVGKNSEKREVDAKTRYEVDSLSSRLSLSGEWLESTSALHSHLAWMSIFHLVLHGTPFVKCKNV